MPTLPDVVTIPLGSLMPLVKVCIPVKILAEVKSNDMEVELPRETAPPPDRPDPAVTVREELTRLAFDITPVGRDREPETFKPKVLIMEFRLVTLREDPIPTLPVALSPLKLESPVTFNPFNAPNPVIDPPTPMFPVVVNVPAYAVPSDAPFSTDKLFKIAAD